MFSNQVSVIVVVKKTLRYSNVFFYNRTPVQPFMPHFRISEHYYGNGIKPRQGIMSKENGGDYEKEDTKNDGGGNNLI